LIEDTLIKPTVTLQSNTSNDSLAALDLSNVDSDYADNDSLDDASFDGMSIVSNSEIQDLEDDLRNFEDEGYDTETTDNTSPSHKFSRPKTRRSSSQARTRIDDLLNPQNLNTLAFNTVPSAPSERLIPSSPLGTNSTNLETSSLHSPHPSPNTTFPCEGPGADTE
jgi:hypothetical protein